MLDESADGGVGAGEELGPHLGTAQSEQCLVCLVGHARRCGLRGHHLPAGRMPLSAGIRTWPRRHASRHRRRTVSRRVAGDLGDDPVEALAVEVDDHREVAEALGCRVGDGLPDVALVEFGVTDQGDESGRILGRRSGRRCSAGSAPRTGERLRRARPNRSRSPRHPDPSFATGMPGVRRARAAG